jgi:hypothetical protein
MIGSLLHALQTHLVLDPYVPPAFQHIVLASQNSLDDYKVATMQRFAFYGPDAFTAVHGYQDLGLYSSIKIAPVHPSPTLNVHCKALALDFKSPHSTTELWLNANQFYITPSQHFILVFTPYSLLNETGK